MQIAKGDILSHWDGSVYVVQHTDELRTVLQAIVECEPNTRSPLFTLTKNLFKSFKLERSA